MILDVKSRITGAESKAVLFDGSGASVDAIKHLFPTANISLFENPRRGEQITIKYGSVQVVARLNDYILSFKDTPIMIGPAKFASTFAVLKPKIDRKK